jgi:hypothetical protein
MASDDLGQALEFMGLARRVKNRVNQRFGMNRYFAEAPSACAW